MRAVRLYWQLIAAAATWAADKIADPGTRHGWNPPRFTYEEQD